jgi:acyl carrier protein
MPPFERWPNLPPIGRPIANTEICILDSHLNPVPIGVVGEIYIGGVGLARGYLNQPELTAEKFITHSLDGAAAKRWYKTGDLARFLSDGNIECLGRMDNQAKIRGYRVELGEIESVLAQHPAIRHTVVLARENTAGDKRLVAYVVAPPDTPPNELRSFLKQKLPEYMVPSALVFLNEVPLSANGKVDRKALPQPDQTRPELDEGFAAPRTPVEEILANVWASVLKLDKVGIHDNFFDLGGHSLMATRVVSRIREVIRIELPIRALFEMPTVATLSNLIESIRWAANENRPTSRESLNRTEEVIL